MTENKPVVLVTGANGFIGRHLTPMLEANGWTVRRALRGPASRANDVAVGSIGPRTDWKDALTNVDAIVHLAARVHQVGEKQRLELYNDTNVEGTLHLARSAVRAGVGRFIFASTALVHGKSSGRSRPLSESDEPAPRNVYAKSKVAAEAGLEALAQHSPMSTTVIRPPLVYGAGVKGNFELLHRAVRRGIPLPFASISNRRAFISVQNLVSFILLQLKGASHKFEVYLVADEEQLSTPEFIRRLARSAGMHARLFPVPPRLLAALIALSGRSEAKESLMGSLELDISKAKAQGWRPPISVDEGLKLATAGSAIGPD
jgi:nucleoside-diphosphate-sugar epimerase